MYNKFNPNLVIVLVYTIIFYKIINFHFFYLNPNIDLKEASQQVLKIKNTQDAILEAKENVMAAAGMF